MRLSPLLCVLALGAALPCAAAEDRAVYGKDDRQELYSVAAQWRELGRSVAGKVSVEHMRPAGGGWELVGPRLSQRECPGNRFGEQITVPSCSGFLAGPDLLVTAAHCIKTQEDCDKYSWVFEYALSGAGDAAYTRVSADRVYKCAKIEARDFQDFGDVDYAILRLDRPVTGRRPLRLGLGARPQAGLPLTNIGHSTGLPLKFKDSAVLTRMRDGDRAFESDLDAFGGDSGSPVFDAVTGEVLGITSSGHTDHYHAGGDNSCFQVKVCRPEDKCHPSVSSGIWNLKNEPVLNAY